MKTTIPFPAFCLVTAFFAQAAFADRIVPLEGRPINGTILLMNETKVSIDTGGGKKEEIAANKIESTSFDGEPSALGSARAAVKGGRSSDALEYLQKVDPKKLPDNPYLKQDYEYLLASVKGMLAMSDSSDAKEAENALALFIKSNQRNYHYYDAVQIYGDLLVSRGKFEQAKKAYEVLSKAPWPEYNLKARVALGNTLISEKKIADARKNFEEVAASGESTPDAEAQKQLAQVGIARCLIGEKKSEDAVKLLEEIASKANPENTLLQAAVYSTLGSAYETSSKNSNAIVAYTSVDVLYPSAGPDHIASLRALSGLWRKTGRIDRAEAVEKKLKDLYNLDVK
ncbi:MAG TPA: hypothetical protein DEB39_15670 [Planctomycetaceae bacterium]|nr:hypothetical protein [Planctomycetaceae bacterium]